MALRWRRKLILAKTEATYGMDSDPVAANAILASNVEPKPLVAEQAERDIERAFFGSSGKLPVNVHMMLSFHVELAGAGAAGTAPAWGPLLRACSFAEVVTANTKVVYNPVTDDPQSITLYIYIDKQLHALKGARGNCTVSVPNNGIPKLQFDFTGLFTAPSSMDPPANPDYSKFKAPVAATKTNTPTFTLLGNTKIGLASLEVNLNNEVVHRSLINAASEVIITDRLATAAMTIDAPKYSDLNLVEKAVAAATGAVQLVHGKTAGNIITLDMPKVQVNSVESQEADKIWQLQVGADVEPNTGNDELLITVT